jgi:4,5-dihydroxyphthalate decarboxylase
VANRVSTRKLQLTLSCGLYEITRALIDREVEAKGIELTFMIDDPRRIYSLRRRNEADIGEFNVAKYFRVREHGHRITALPIYPHRRFRHGYCFVNTTAGVRDPADLIGHRAGIVGRTPAAGVWIRGILQDRHRLPLEAVDWRENPPEPMNSAEPELEPNIVTEATLLAGEVDLLLAPRIPAALAQGDPRIARLFPDHVEQSIAYYRETGIFPIMHALTIREEILERHPWVAESIYSAFEEAKRIGYERVSNPRLTPLAFFEAAWEEQRELLGPDPWEYGLGETNRRNLETVARYAREQGWITSEPSLSELFVEVG